MEPNNYINEIILSGRLIGIKENKDGSCFLKIISNSGNDIYPSFLYMDKLASTYKLRDKVDIKGHVSYAKTTTNGNINYVQRLIADSVEKTKTLVEERFGPQAHGKFFKKPNCVLNISGKVINVAESKTGGWQKFNIETTDPVLQKPVKLFLNMKEIDRPKKISAGDEICAVCGLATPKKFLNGQNVYFENINIYDIDKIS